MNLIEKIEGKLNEGEFDSLTSKIKKGIEKEIQKSAQALIDTVIESPEIQEELTEIVEKVDAADGGDIQEQASLYAHLQMFKAMEKKYTKNFK